MAPATPLVAFGEGLSYTEFTFSDVKLSTSNITADSTFDVTLNIASSGPAGKCVVQVYFSQQLSSRARYQQMLLGFTKVALPANSTGTPAKVSLRASNFEMWDKHLKKYVVEPGTFDIMVGQSSVDKHMWKGTITVA